MRAAIAGAAAFWGIALGLYFLYAVRDVLMILFIAWIVAAGLRPGVEQMERRMPRAAAVLLVYLAFFSGLGLLGWLIVPPLVVQTADLISRAPVFIQQAQQLVAAVQDRLAVLGLRLDLAQQLASLASYAGQAAQAAINVPIVAARILFDAVAVLVVGFYWLTTRERAIGWLAEVFWPRNPEEGRSLIERAEDQLGAYVRGLAVLALSVGGATLIGLLLLGVPYAVPLAVLAGVLELLPIIGPIIAAVPGIIIAALRAPLLGLGAVVLYIAIQQLENYVLVPKVHEKAIGLQPLVVLVAVLLGSSLAGISGAIVAVPVAALVALIIEEVRQRRPAPAPAPPVAAAGERTGGSDPPAER